MFTNLPNPPRKSKFRTPPHDASIPLAVDRDAFDIELTALVSYSPGRPMPACSNPSHPSYADPGDESQCEVVCVLLGDDVWPGTLTDAEERQVHDLADAAYGKALDDALCDRADHAWEDRHVY